MTHRYTVTENRDGLGFSDGISQSDAGEYVSFRDYEALAAEVIALRKRVEAADAMAAAITAYCVAEDQAAETCHEADYEAVFDCWGTFEHSLATYRATVTP